MGRSALRLALVAWLVSAPAARAQDPFQRNFDAVPLKATPAQDSGIALEGALLPAAGSWRAALLLDYAHAPLALAYGEEKLGNLIPYRLDAHLLGAWQLLPRLELGLDVPFTLVQGDRFSLLRERLGVTDFPGAAGVSRWGLGDVRLVPRVGLLDPDAAPLGLAVVTELRLPTGDGQSFLGEHGVLFAPRVALEKRLGPVRVLGNVGARLRHHAQFLNLYVDDEVTFGAGAVVDLPDVGPLHDVRGLAEVNLATPTSAPFTFTQAGSLKTPLSAMVGARARLAGPWGVELAVGRGLALDSGYGREALRVMLSLRYDFTFADQDGDGVADANDKCPTEKEDRDGFQDGDGCLDPDNDGDGVEDREDACPTTPGTPELDGCTDRDGDEVPDNSDRCPDVAGPPENDGCPYGNEPLVEVESDRIRIKGNITFETGSARIQPQSFPLLDEVYRVLNQNPTLGPVLIEGHTDNRGGRALNLDLSNRRARSVVEYLVKKGIAQQRLQSRGFGFDRPVASNATALGRAKNRRVEFRLLRANEETGGEPLPVPEDQKQRERLR